MNYDNYSSRIITHHQKYNENDNMHILYNSCIHINAHWIRILDDHEYLSTSGTEEYMKIKSYIRNDTWYQIRETKITNTLIIHESNGTSS